MPLWLLVVGWLGIACLSAAAGRAVGRSVVPAGERAGIGGVVGPLMPALGATFAVLTAITLSSEAGYLKSAQDGVSNEAAAAARLAWSATSPGVDTATIQSALADYVRTTRRQEWSGDPAERGDDEATRAAIGVLERGVRGEAVRPELGTPVSTELLASVDAVTSTRRARIAAADRELPTLYVVTVVASGLVLVANAGVLAGQVGRRAALLTGGLAVVVGLSLALLFAISAPWQGPMVVDGEPIDIVADDIGTGFFTL